MGPTGNKAAIMGKKPDGSAMPGPPTGHEKRRRLRAEAVLLVRYAVLAWTGLLFVLLVSLIGVVDLDVRLITDAAMTYAGVVAAVMLAVGTTGLLIWVGELAKGRLKRRVAQLPAHGPGGRNSVWDKWLDFPSC